MQQISHFHLEVTVQIDTIAPCQSNVISFFIFSFQSSLLSVSTSPLLCNTTSNMTSFILLWITMYFKWFLQLFSKYLVHLSNVHFLKMFKIAAIKAGSPSVTTNMSLVFSTYALMFSSLYFMAIDFIAVL